MPLEVVNEVRLLPTSLRLSVQVRRGCARWGGSVSELLMGA